METKKYRFDEVTINFDKKRIPLSSAQREKRQGTFRYYGAQGVIDHVDDYIFDGTYLLIAEDGENLKSKKQNIAQVVDGQFWVNNHAHIVQGNEQCDTRFLCYLINSMDLSGYVTGSAQPKLSQANLNAVTLSLPTLAEQKRIVEYLYMLDQKIDVNRQINDNLQQQALSVFRKAFINIEELPSSWTKGCLLDIADYLNGLAMQKFRPSENEIGIPVLKIKELRQGSCDASSELCSPSIKTEYIIHDGDVVFSWSGSLLVDIWCGGTCGLNQHLFKVTSKTYDKWFYYLWTAHHLERFIAIAADKATTMGHIKREELSKAEVVIPSQNDYEKIGAVLQPMIDLIIANRIENKKLATLRDELLPKLMSGEIDVSEVAI
jgi:type I restriction enzyme S subunit